MENLKIETIYSLHVYTTEKCRWSAKAPRQGCYFAYQRRGTYTHILRDRELTASPGTVLFINNEDPYDVIGDGGSDAICAVIGVVDAPASFAFSAAGDKSFAKLFNALLLCADTSLASNRYTALGILYKLFGKISREQEKKSLSSASRLSVENVRRYIYAHYADSELNMDRLSAVGNAEVHRLNALFKEEYGIPCWQFVIAVRMETACNYLKATDYSVSNIAELCGFSDPYYFSRAFGKTFGISPSAFRKNKVCVLRD